MALRKNPTYEQDSEKFLKECYDEDMRLIAEARHELVSDAPGSIATLKRLTQSDDENIALKAALGHLQLIKQEHDYERNKAMNHSGVVVINITPEHLAKVQSAAQLTRGLRE